jgi:2'-5' RNA ligase
MSTAATRFVALEPDEAFARQVIAYKERVRACVGDQVYLSHPPHMTLYASVFPEGADLAGPLGEAAARLSAPRVAIRGWHVFEADQLTGNHTVVCNVTDESLPRLRAIQRAVVECASPVRDRRAAHSCYAAAWERLSAEERQNVERFGFPFAGSIWRPHVTVASIRPDDWAAAWSALEHAAPEADARFVFLSLFGFEGDEPFRIERFVLGDAE